MRTDDRWTHKRYRLAEALNRAVLRRISENGGGAAQSPMVKQQNMEVTGSAPMARASHHSSLSEVSKPLSHHASQSLLEQNMITAIGRAHIGSFR
jgi:hypothetical protein